MDKMRDDVPDSDDNGRYQYYAFISYSRRDEREAKQLHRAIEKFKIPSDLPGLPGPVNASRRIRPVFRDKTDLDVAPESFIDQLVRNLADSRFLIVLCSPSAARSRPNGKHYIDWEIREFIKAHGLDYAKNHILPVLLAGEPGCADPERECMPPALLELGRDFLEHNFPTLIGSVSARRPDKSLWEQCLIDTVSFLLGVRKSVIQNRYLQESRRRLRNIVTGCGIIALALASLTVWAFEERNNAEQQRDLAVTARKVAEENQKVAESEKLRADAQAEEARKQRDEAEKQEKISGGAFDFVQGMFDSIDPSKAKKHNVTVMEILDQTDEKLGKDKEMIPEVRFRLRNWMSTAYYKIGEHAKAVENAKDALSTAISLSKDGKSLDVVSCHNNLGMFLADGGNYDEAISEYSSAVDVYNAIPEASPSVVGSVRNNIGDIATRLDSFQEAEEMYQLALNDRKEAFGEDSAPVEETINNIGHCKLAQGKTREALEVFTENLERCKRIYGGEDNLGVARTLNNISICQSSLGNYSEALKAEEQTMEIYSHFYKNDNEAMAIGENNIGLCHFYMGHYKDAIAAYDKALKILGNVYDGNNSPDQALFQMNKAMCLSSLGDYNNAILVHQEALKNAEQLYGDDHSTIALILSNLAICQYNTGRYVEAKISSSRATDLFEKTYGDSMQLASSMQTLGTCMIATDEYDKGVAMLNDSLRMIRKLYPGDNATTAVALNNIASELGSHGSPDKALEMMRESLEMYKRLHENADHPDIARTNANIGVILNNEGNDEESLSYFVASLEMYKRLGCDQTTDYANCLYSAAQVKIKIGKLEEALADSKECLDVKFKSYGENNSEVALACESVATCYALLNRQEDAKPYLARAAKIREALNPAPSDNANDE